MTPLQLRTLRTFDKLIGPPLLRWLKPSARAGQPSRPVPAESVRRLLVVRPGGLGDAVLTLPMIAALKKNYANATIDVLAEKRNADVYRIGELVDEVYLYDTNPIGVIRRLRRNRYDLVVDTEQFHRLSRVIANAMHAEYLCGFDTTDQGRLLTHAISYSDDMYEAKSFLRLAEAVIGSPVPFDAERPFVSVLPATRNWARKHLGTIDEKLVTVMTVAGGEYRLWTTSRYAEIVTWLTDRNYRVVLLGGSDGIDAAAAIAADNRSDRVLNLAGQTSLAQTAAMLELADLSLSADTGIVHLAYGLGTSTIALFGPGRYRKWAPPGRRNRIVRKGLTCSPCTKFGRVPTCPHDIACMKEISVQNVIAAMEELLDPIKSSTG